MNSSSMQKIIILIGVMILLILFVYSLFFSKSGDVNIVIDPNKEVVGEDILVLVEKLKKISINKSIFASVLFTNLKDYSAVLFPEQKGRPNPFAFVGQDVSQTQDQDNNAPLASSTPPRSRR